MDHESRQGTRHQTGDSGTVVRSSYGVPISASWSRLTGEPGYRFAQARQSDLRARLLLAWTPTVFPIKAADDAQEILEQETRSKYQARRTLPKNAAENGLAGTGRMGVRDPETGKALAEVGKVFA